MNLIGLCTLITRELKRTFKIINQVIWPPIISTLLYFFIFVIGLGRAVGTMEGMPYVQYLLPGLIFMHVVETSFSESAASLFIMRFTTSIQELLVAPLSYTEMVLGMIVGSTLRALIIGNLIMLVGLPFGGQLPVNWWWYSGLLIAIAVLFSALGLVMGLAAESFDQMAIPSTFLLTPLIFLGGVFISPQQLPGQLQVVALYNPLFYLIDGFRTALTGHASAFWLLDVSLTVSCALAALLVVIRLFRQGYQLRP